MIRILSLPGTGTRFLQKLLKDEEFETDHLWPESVEHWTKILLAKDPIIVPLRHPLEVAKTWKRRADSGYTLETLPEWWRLLVGKVDPVHPHYLPLDVPTRVAYLDKINLDLELELTTGWPMIGQGDGNQAGELTDAELASIRTTMDWGEPFFSRFGYA